MVKKILIISLCLILAFSVVSFAEEVPQERQMPQGNMERQRPQDGQRPDGGMGGGRGGMGADMQPPEMTEGEMPENMPSPRNPEEQQADNTQQSQTDLTHEGQTQETEQNFPQRGQGMQGGFQGQMNGDMQQATAQNQSKSFTDILKEYSTPVISVILLALAFLFVIFYKRKNY